jgi:flagellar assembly factor FliW
MKVLAELIPSETDSFPTRTFLLPHGIVGFPEYTRGELVYNPDHLPFVTMQLHGPSGSISFVVVEPFGFIRGYEPELFEADASALGLSDPSEAMVLTILTMTPGAPLEATVNLVGPIVVNRRTGIGRQVVVSNYSRYRARHPLLSPPATAA